MNKKKIKPANVLAYSWILVLGSVATVAYYINYEEYLKGEWFPTVGAFVASHGAVVGGTLHLIDRIKRLKGKK